MTEWTEDQQTRMGMAACFAALAAALKANGQIRAADFEKGLSEAYADLKESGANSIGALETVTWAGDMFRSIK